MMKVLFLTALLVSCFLVGCVSSNVLSFSSKTQLKLVMSSVFINSDSGVRHIVKVTPELRKYCGELKKDQYALWSDSCEFGSNPPSTIKLEYTTIPISKEDMVMRDKRNTIILRQAQSLPPSAWRTHTIYPKQLLEQGRAMPAKGMPASHWHKTSVTVTLYIDGNGNISQEIKHEPVKVGNPYA